MKHLQHFSLIHEPLGKSQQQALKTPQYDSLNQQLDWLLQTKGVGVITGEPGTGKTTAIRHWVKQLNPLQYQTYYQSDNQFKPFDIYAQFAESLGLEKQYRYSQLWRQIKAQILHLHQDKKITPIWLLDEAQLLPFQFLIDLPAFLNVNFDTQDLAILLLIGTPKLQTVLQRASCAALASRVQFHHAWQPFSDLSLFTQFVKDAFAKAGRRDTLLSDSGIQLIHINTKGNMRCAHRIINRAMQLAYEKQINHLPDDIIEQAIQSLCSMGI